MSAMHWEARRRQSMLDRRMATKAKHSLTEDREKEGATEQVPRDLTPSAVNTAPLHMPVVEKSISCQCQLATVKEQYSTKIENRFTSKQYSQQW